MSEFYFIESHECFQLSEGQAVVSVSEYAVEQLGEITYVQLPSVGQKLAQGESFGEIESVKTVSELYAPLAGSVSAVNEQLADQPELVNDSPLDKGWLIKIQPDSAPDTGGYMNAEAYQNYLDGLR